MTIALSVPTHGGQAEGRVRHNVLVKQLGERLQIATITGCEHPLNG
jgi:hypothetical protein